MDSAGGTDAAPPIALDESVARLSRHCAPDLGAGGRSTSRRQNRYLRSLQIAAIARAAGLKLMISCMAETAAGLSPSVHLALGTGFFSWVDLDSDHLLVPQRGDPGWTRRGPILTTKR